MATKSINYWINKGFEVVTLFYNDGYKMSTWLQQKNICSQVATVVAGYSCGRKFYFFSLIIGKTFMYR